VAAGADGVILEVHPQPDEAWSDGRQSLKPGKFGRLVKQMKAVAQAVGRDIPANPIPAGLNGHAVAKTAVLAQRL
jgi:3-deoxy-7-phosphoheptulonate synthase